MLVICFMLFGCLIFLCKESRVMDNGHYSVIMRLQAWQIVGVKNLRSCILIMRERLILFYLFSDCIFSTKSQLLKVVYLIFRARQRRLSKHRTCGLRS